MHDDLLETPIVKLQAITTFMSATHRNGGMQILDNATFRSQYVSRVCPRNMMIDAVPIIMASCGLELSISEWQSALCLITSHCKSKRQARASEMLVRSASGASLGDGSHQSSGSGSDSDCSASSRSSIPDSHAGIEANWMETASREELVQAICNRDAKIGRLHDMYAKTSDKLKDKSSESKVKGQHVRRLKRRMAAISDEFEDYKKTKQEFEINRENRTWFTANEYIAMAIRRNFANLASQDLGLVLLQDISRWTVVRAEVKTHAALLIL